jgi:uncharacterized membrane protein YdjX (TVP38/TMEM64 family)
MKGIVDEGLFIRKFTHIMKIRIVSGRLFTWRNVFLLLIVLGIVVLLLDTSLFKIILEGDIQKIKNLSGDNPLIILLFSTFVMLLQNTFTIIPLLLVITINVTLFGFLFGFLWSWFTSILAAIVIFFLVRYLFQDFLLSKVDEKLVEKVENKGFLFVFEARILPFVPTSLVNILAGVSTITFSNFLLGTLLGNFIYFFILSLIPAGLLSSTVNKYMLFAISLLILTVTFMYRKKSTLNKSSKKEKKHTG